MTPTQVKLYQTAVWSTLASAALVVVSIAACQILLGVALIALIASDAPLRFPPIKAPLAAFLGWTVISLLASADPRAGLPQIRKFFVFTVLLVVYSTLRETRQARWLVGAWSLAAAASALRSLVQFVRKVEAARAQGEDFYQFYVGERITGFLSHWMTFSEVGMLVLLVLLSYLFFAPEAGRRVRFLGCLAGVFLAGSLLVSFTRNIWLATAAASGYLVWNWRKRLLLVLPLLAVLVFFFGPEILHRRIESMFRADSSVQARQIMWRTGWRMIQARPLVGVGPMRVGPEFPRFLPAGAGELPPGYYEHLHNLYIHYAAERGVPALLALLWLLGRILRDHLKALGARRFMPEDRFILHAVVAVLIGIAVGGMFEVNLGDSEVLTVFLTVVALGYAAIDRPQPR